MFSPGFSMHARLQHRPCGIFYLLLFLFQNPLDGYIISLLFFHLVPGNLKFLKSIVKKCLILEDNHFYQSIGLV